MPGLSSPPNDLEMTMLINTPEGDMSTTTAKLITALEGINVRVYGTDDTVVDVEVKRGVETDEHSVNMLCHPWRETGPGTHGFVDRDHTLIIPVSLIVTLEVL